MVDRLKINQFYTAPTALRSIKRMGDEFVTKYKRTSLRILGSVGEPINPAVIFLFFLLIQWFIF